MSRTVPERIDLLKDEIHALRNAGPGAEARRSRLQRQLAMLTESERKPMAIPQTKRGRA